MGMWIVLGVWDLGFGLRVDDMVRYGDVAWCEIAWCLVGIGIQYLTSTLSFALRKWSQQHHRRRWGIVPSQLSLGLGVEVHDEARAQVRA